MRSISISISEHLSHCVRQGSSSSVAEMKPVDHLPEVWFYQDLVGKVEGPFKPAEMRAWHEQKWWKQGQLCGSHDFNRLYTLESLWPDPKTAFSTPPRSDKIIREEERAKGPGSAAIAYSKFQNKRTVSKY
jgi:hypothetical protein